MPRGGKTKYAPKKNYKGAHRHFTDEDELKRQFEEEQRKKAWRAIHGSEEEEEVEDKDEKGNDKTVNRQGAPGELPDSSDSDEDDDDEDDENKAKGVQHLIAKEIENPNRVVQKTIKIKDLKLEDDTVPVAAAVSAGAPTAEPGGDAQGMNRKEREELERQKAKARYQKMHAEGKTDEAQADLARLAIVKKQREEAARKRDEEIKAREAAKLSAKASAQGKTT